MYSGLSKETGGIVGDGILYSKEEDLDFVEVSESTAANESLVCYKEVEVDERIEIQELVMVSYIDHNTGLVEWTQTENPHAEFNKKVSTSQMTSMLLDKDRNNMYELAISKAIEYYQSTNKEAPIVLDIGAGTGLLSMLSVKHGAAFVYACEMFGHLTNIANEIIASNNLSDKILITPCKSSTIETGSFQADLLVSELLDTFLLGEGCLLSHMDAIQRKLVRNNLSSSSSSYDDVDDEVEDLSNRVIPHSAEVYACIIESSEVSQSLKATPSLFHENFVPYRDENAKTCAGNIGMIPIHWPEFQSRGDAKILSDWEKIMYVDFYSPQDPDKISKEIYDVKLNHSGKASAVLLYWKAYLLSPEIDPERKVYYTTEPGILNWQDHWLQAIYPLPNEISCESGDSISLNVFRNSLRIWFDISTAAVAAPNDSEDSSRIASNASKRFKCNDDGNEAEAEAADADGIEEDELAGDQGGIQQMNNKNDEEDEDNDEDEDEDDEYLPSGCRCGWHLLCDSDRLSALNDRDRIELYQLAIDKTIERFLHLSSNDKVPQSQPNQLVSIDVSDGSLLAFLLGLKLIDRKAAVSDDVVDCKIISRERKQFSYILSSQLVSPNGLDDILYIWDGNDLEELQELLNLNDHESDEEEEENISSKNIKANLLLCEDNFYQLKHSSVQTAISFYYTRSFYAPFLSEDCIVMPSRASVMIAGIELTQLAPSSYGKVGRINGFDHDTYDQINSNWSNNFFPYKLSDYKKKFLTKPVEVLSFDYQSCQVPLWTSSVFVPFISSGRFDAVVVWVDYTLADGVPKLSPVDTSGECKPYMKFILKFSPEPYQIENKSEYKLTVKTLFQKGDSDINIDFFVE